MQAAAARLTPLGPAGIGKIAVTGEQEFVESGIGQQGCIQGLHPPRRGEVLTTMAKIGRNDPCPCGSGKKYKACCLTTDAAAEREGMVGAQAARDQRATEHRLRMQEFEAAIAAQIAGAEDDEDDELTTAANAAVALVRAGKLDEAEAAARDLLLRYPDVPDGWDRLGMVHEARWPRTVKPPTATAKFSTSSASIPATTMRLTTRTSSS